jgi:hypothetical protein
MKVSQRQYDNVFIFDDFRIPTASIPVWEFFHENPIKNALISPHAPFAG